MTSTIPLTEATEQRDLYLAASRAIAAGKAYTIGNRQLTRLDAADVRDQLAYWNRAIKQIEASANPNIRNAGSGVATWT